MSLAPIALIVYRRPDILKRTLLALKQNRSASESELFIFSDGPKANAPLGDIEKIEKVRKLIRSEKWCGKVTIIESDKNKGLNPSVIDGINEIIHKFGKIIVLEDDILPSDGFLDYMNDSLNLYQDTTEIMSICGWNFAMQPNLPDTYLLRYFSSWGWATWQDRWAKYLHDLSPTREYIESNLHRFTFDGCHRELYYLYLYTLRRGVLTWDIRWYTTIFCNNGLSLFPSKPMVLNIGNTIDSENTTELYEILNVKHSLNHAPLRVTRQAIAENESAREVWRNFYRLYNPGFVKDKLYLIYTFVPDWLAQPMRRVLMRIKRIIRRLS